MSTHAAGSGGEDARRVAVVLHEHEVPDLQPAVALALDAQARASRRYFGAGNVVALEEVHLRAGTARPRLALAQKLSFAPSSRMRSAGTCASQKPCASVSRGTPFSPLKMVTLSRSLVEPHAPGEELPGVRDRVLLEVVAEREVAQHLEEGVVARRVSHVLEVVVLAPGAHALLRRRGPVVVALLAAQFKDVFTGREKRDYNRATTSQKCVRAGGKHNDLENVGFTARHHTFFEMLGNFSFGDYFKKDAIALRLGVRDRGARGSTGPARRHRLQRRERPAAATTRRRALARSGVPAERILSSATRTTSGRWATPAPAAPAARSTSTRATTFPAPSAAGRACLGVACDCDRWLEFWNLVFMQFERDAKGELTPLPKPSIDTGAGLERIAACSRASAPTTTPTCSSRSSRARRALRASRYGAEPDDRRVHARHRRPLARDRFLIADGVMPVQRRPRLRAPPDHAPGDPPRPEARLRATVPVPARPCGVKRMGGAYPELHGQLASVVRVVKAEEDASAPRSSTR